jgi:hypothetical protein
MARRKSYGSWRQTRNPRRRRPYLMGSALPLGRNLYSANCATTKSTARYLYYYYDCYYSDTYS